MDKLNYSFLKYLSNKRNRYDITLGVYEQKYILKTSLTE